MKVEQLIIIQIIGHVLTDFIFQSNKSAKSKNKLGFKSGYLKWHACIAFIFSWGLSLNIEFFFGALIIGITHYFIDGTKKYIEKIKRVSDYSFFIDQILHLSVIFFVVFQFEKQQEVDLIIPLNTKFLLIILGYILCMKPSNIFIKQIFQISSIKVDGGKDLPNAGKLIGTLERFLVFTFIILKQFEAVGFLIAAKSILRYKEGETLKTEYVLIGTMLSFGIALFLGIIVQFYRV